MKPKYLELTEADLEKVRLRKQRDEVAKVPPEWRLVAEFGMYYGWQGVQAVRNNDIDITTFNHLLAGARKVKASDSLQLSKVMFASIAATKSKKPEQVFTQVLKNLYSEVRE